MADTQATEEERTHCEKAIQACGGYYEGRGADTVDAEDAIECLIAERAAARVAGLAEGLNNRALNVGCVTLGEYRALQSKLEAVSVELAVLKERGS